MRDLEKDLEICNAAPQGPWVKGYNGGITGKTLARIHRWGPNIGLVSTKNLGEYSSVVCVTPFPNDDVEKFIAEAREGWPHAIKRAIEAEKRLEIAEEKVDQLIHEMRMLQDELNRRGCHT